MRVELRLFVILWAFIYRKVIGGRNDFHNTEQAHQAARKTETRFRVGLWAAMARTLRAAPLCGLKYEEHIKTTMGIWSRRDITTRSVSAQS